jgi:hypothetical protein
MSDAMSLPTPYAAARVAGVSRDADTVILYMTANTPTTEVGGCCAGS